MAFKRGLQSAFAVTCLVGCTLLPASGLTAQTPRFLDTGTRVRVRFHYNPLPLVGRLADVQPDSLYLARPSGSFERWRPVALADIAGLEVSGGRRRLTVIGLAVGAVAGVTMTAAYNRIVESQCFLDCHDGFPVGIGALIGGIGLGSIFHFIRVERWFPIAVPQS